MKIYIGEKGKDTNGNASSDSLSRNGLAYGSYYYLNDLLPTTEGQTSTDGTLDTTTDGALRASKFEDVDTSPSDPTQAVLENESLARSHSILISTSAAVALMRRARDFRSPCSMTTLAPPAV